jgi:hypothetical protein
MRVRSVVVDVAVRKKLLRVNPCFALEFAVASKGLLRPHYYVAVGAQRIESQSIPYTWATSSGSLPKRD